MSGTPANRNYYVLNALGSDRPGIVARVTDFLKQHGCNVEESRMAILGGEFGLLMLVSAEESVSDDVSGALEDFQADTGLEIRWRATLAPETHRARGAVPYIIRTYAVDQEGIIHGISQTLSSLDVNIVSASTSSYLAPISGTPLFKMEMEIDVPAQLELSKLRSQLEQVGEELNADVELAFEETGR